MDLLNFRRVGFTLLLLCTGIMSLHAQREFVASGGDASGSGGSASYSVGQVGYVNFDGEDFRMNAGVQQPNILIMVDTDDPLDGFTLTAYPNPSTNSVYLMISPEVFNSNAADKLAYQLHSANGALLAGDNIDAPSTHIQLNTFPSGYFILRVISDKKEIKSFKLFKTN